MNENTLLILVGLALLLINVIIGAVQLRQGTLRAGVFNVLLALVACVLIAVGIVRISFAPIFSGPAVALAAPAQPGSAPINVSNNTVTDPDVVALRNGTVPAPMMAALAKGTIPAAMQTVMADRSAGNAAAPRVASNVPTSAATAGVLAANRMTPLATAAGAVVIIVAGLALYVAERRRQAFNPSTSAGLLNTGAGIFTLVAALVVPIIPIQLTAAQAPVRAAALAQVATGTLAFGGTDSATSEADSGTADSGTTAAKPVIVDTATPTGTAVPSTTPTAVPSLTPAPSETPIVLVTQIAYVSTDTNTTPVTNCTVTANDMLNLRGDPSASQRAIGKVFVGSLLPVTGQSADKKWWRVINTDQNIAVEGWVNAEFVAANPSCASANVPVITVSATPSATPR